MRSAFRRPCSVAISTIFAGFHSIVICSFPVYSQRCQLPKATLSAKGLPQFKCELGAIVPAERCQPRLPLVFTGINWVKGKSNN